MKKSDKVQLANYLFEYYGKLSDATITDYIKRQHNHPSLITPTGRLSKVKVQRFIEKYSDKVNKVVTPVVEPTHTSSDSTTEFDIVFAFDTTGSMRSYIASVRKQVEDFTNTLFENVPNLQVGICAFGDYADCIDIRFQYTNLVSDKKVVIDAIRSYKNTDGDDYEEFYEYVIKKLTDTTNWRKDSTRMIILIGDAKPHQLGYTYKKEVVNNQLDWKVECQNAAKKGITMHTLQITKEPWYIEAASITNGICVPFKNADKISELLKGLVYIDSNMKQFKVEQGKAIASGDKQLIDSYKLIEEKRTKTDLAIIFGESKESVTVCFHKQLTREYLENVIGNYFTTNGNKVDRTKGKTEKELAKLCELGELTTMLCKYTGKKDEFGRFIVIDLNEKGKFNTRVVDPRTIEYIEIKGTRYNKK